jgi:hypothetical protein
MKTALRQVMLQWIQHPESQQHLDWILRLKDEKGWKALQQFIMFLRVQMRETPISREFQKLAQDEQRALIKTLSWMDEFLVWMMNPMTVVETMMKVKKHNEDIAERTKPRRAAGA